jgi:hypothetical protein
MVRIFGSRNSSAIRFTVAGQHWQAAAASEGE